MCPKNSLLPKISLNLALKSTRCCKHITHYLTLVATSFLLHLRERNILSFSLTGKERQKKQTSLLRLKTLLCIEYPFLTQSAHEMTDVRRTKNQGVNVICETKAYRLFLPPTPTYVSAPRKEYGIDTYTNSHHVMTRSLLMSPRFEIHKRTEDGGKMVIEFFVCTYIHIS